MRLFLIVSLFTIAVLAVCSALVWWAFGLNLSDDQMRRLQNTSAVAQNVGLVALVLAVPGVIILIVEQRRIHEDLARRPKLFVGFDSDRHSDGTLTATGNEKSVDALFLADNLYSEEVCFYFVAVNIGTRSARDLIWNVDFSRNIQIVERRVGLFRRSYIEGADRRILVIMQPYLHRDDAFRPEVF